MRPSGRPRRRHQRAPGGAFGTGIPNHIFVAALLFAAGASEGLPALALEEVPGEQDVLFACEQRVCSMILDKGASGRDLECHLTKTWGQSTIKSGETKSAKWGFGDARCTVDVSLSREDIAAALTKPDHTIEIPSQKVACVVERDGVAKPVTAKLSPRLVFKKGRADKIWINLKEIEGPDDIKGTIWTIANLEDTIGIFHRSMIKQINKFVHRKCRDRYGPDAATNGKAKDKTKGPAQKAEGAGDTPARPDAVPSAPPAAAEAK